MTYALRLLGGVRLEGPDGPIEGSVARRQRLSLLAYLAMDGRDGVSRDRVVGLFWPDSPDARARHALSDDLYALRSGLGESVVLAFGDDLRIDRNLVSVDACSFEEASSEKDLEKAAELYGGHFMDGVRLKSGELERWVESHRRRLTSLYSTVLEELAGAESALGSWTAAADWYHKAVANQPLNTRFTLGLMQALANSGDLAGALRQARVHAQMLSTELGVDPDDSVQTLAEELRSGAYQAMPVEVGGAAAVEQQAEGAEVGPTDVPMPNIEAPAESIAVLPFANLSGSPDLEYIGDGLAEEIIHCLTAVDGLRVAARTSAFAFRNVADDIRQIAGVLGVANVLEGSVRVAGGRIRVTAQLIDAASGFHLWSERFDRPLEDVLTIQDEVGRSVALRVSGSDEAIPQRPDQPRPEAHQLLLKGRHALAQVTDESTQHAIGDLKRCVDTDPNYAAGWAALAEAHILMTVGVGHPRKLSMASACAAAERALSLDPDHAGANLVSGLVAMYYEWDHPRAERLLRRGLELAPGSSNGHLWLGWFLSKVRASDPTAQVEAVRELNAAVDLDPRSPLTLLLAGYGHWSLQGYDHSLALFERLVVEAPELDFGHLGVGDALLELGRTEEAVPHLWRALELLGGSTLTCAVLAGAFGRAGILDPLPDLMERLRTPAYSDSGVEHVGKALAFMGAGEGDAALDQLELALKNREHALLYLATAPEFEPLTSRPRFREVVAAIGIELNYG